MSVSISALVARRRGEQKKDEANRILGGHLNECFISATGEITVTKIEERGEEMSREIGLNLYRF